MINNAYSPLSFSPSVADALLRNDHNFIITGAGGWLGQATLEMLDQALGDTMHKRVMAYSATERKLYLRSGRIIPCHALQDIATLTPQKCLMFHYAFLTRDKVSDMSLDAFIAQNTAISNTVLDAVERLGVSGVFVPSSGAVYRADRSIDEDREKNPYGVMKARDERRFLALSTARRVIVSRIFNLGGPFINKISNYALSSIIMDMLNERSIALQADKPVWRSYMHVRDVVDLAMALLLSDTSFLSAPFDTAGEQEIEIGDLAHRIAQILGKPGYPIHRPGITGLENRYVGDGTTIRALLAEHAIIPHTLNRQIMDTVEYCRSLL